MSFEFKRQIAVFSKKLPAVAVACLLATQARADVRVDCNSQFLDEVRGLSGPDMNREIAGVRARDWQPDTVDEWQRQALACIERKRDWADAMKDPMRQAVRATATQIKGAGFEQRKEVLGAEATRQTVQGQGLNQVTLYANGQPQEITIHYGLSNLTQIRTCGTIKRGIGFAKAESYRQAVAFARMCQQSRQTDAATVSMLERQAAGIGAVYDAIDGLADLGEAAIKQPPTDARYRELAAARDRVAAQIQALGLPLDDAQYLQAAGRIETMKSKLDAQACGGQLAKAGFPAAWTSAYVLLEWNAPDRFAPLVCAAQRNGAVVRYLPAGLLSKEGFEIKSSQRTVQVFVQAERVPGGDPNLKVLAPVSAKIDGKSSDINRGNLRVLAAELISAVRNQ